MDAFGKIFSSVTQALDFNQATLSGCVDIVVVQQPDGSLKSTPFHIRLGKLKVLKSKNKEVQIHVNGLETSLKMKLGDAGEGFFEHEKIIRPKSYTKFSGNKMQFELSSPESQAETSFIQGQQNKKLANMLSLKHTNSSDKTSATSKIGNDDQVIEGIDEIKLDIDEEIIYQEKTRYISVKTIRPTSQQLKSLNLRFGINTITYTVNTNLQGSQTMSGHIYYWPSDANIIVSDIDGTITKSDFLGLVMPMIGKEWSQPGITSLYTNVKKNGYHILYLTARPIGQSTQTKTFLESLYQDGTMLPHGPLFMSPDRTVPSIKRELSRRPELFKMACLKDIQSLFPVGHNPFHAGFGNRETDAIAYRSVGIPFEKVFIVNPQGHIHHHNSAVAKSYAIINTMLKEIFPGVETNRHITFPEDQGEAVPLEINDKAQMTANVLKVVS